MFFLILRLGNALLRLEVGEKIPFRIELDVLPNETQDQLPLAAASSLNIDNLFYKFRLVIAPASGYLQGLVRPLGKLR
jgi:hypothetical protein